MKIAVLLPFLVIGLFLSSAVVPAQQTDRDLYIDLYRKGDYEKAAIVLKRVTKNNAGDSDAWYYLGNALLALKKEKDAIKALEKGLALKPDEPFIRTSLAYAYLLRNDKKAEEQALRAIKLNPLIPDAHYVLGVYNLRAGSAVEAYECSKKTIELNPKFANAYLLKSQALIAIFAGTSGTKPPTPNRSEFLKESADAIEKYLAIAPQGKEKDFYTPYFESIKFFAEYYKDPKNQETIADVPPASTDPHRVPINILLKPRAEYTDDARSRGISGTVRLLIGFSAEGTIGHILIIKSLDQGLDRNAVAAARKIKFIPLKIDGKPTPTAMTFEYGFNIY